MRNNVNINQTVLVPKRFKLTLAYLFMCFFINPKHPRKHTQKKASFLPRANINIKLEDLNRKRVQGTYIPRRHAFNHYITRIPAFLLIEILPICLSEYLSILLVDKAGHLYFCRLCLAQDGTAVVFTIEAKYTEIKNNYSSIFSDYTLSIKIPLM